MSISPRLKIVYLLAVSTAVFVLGQRGVLALLALQAVFWLAAGVPAAGGYQKQNGGQYWTVPPANYYGNVW